MKRTSIALAFIAAATAAAWAQTPVSCVDLSSSLSRGMENNNVLTLQNFLYVNGYLKATPNGYFGPGTFAAVKALQKYLGYSQVGIAGPATRAYIKTATCTSGNGQTSTISGNQSASSSQQPSVAVTVSPVGLKPQLDSIDLVTLFAGGQTGWGFNLYGSNFSSASNTVLFKNLGNGSIYTIGTFGSATGTVIILPQNIGNTKFSCGTGCFQSLSSGAYEISVQTPGGTTSGKFIEVKPFTIQSQTGSVYAAIPSVGSNVKLGTLTFSSSVGVVVKSVTFVVSTSTISSDGIGTLSYSDVMRGGALAADVDLSPFQSMIIDATADTSNIIPGTLTGYFVVTVEDYIGKRATSFTSPPFLVTVQGSL